MKITYYELREIKHKLPTGSVKRIAESLSIDEKTVREYFGANSFQQGQLTGKFVQPGPENGIVNLKDTAILDAAMRILRESELFDQEYEKQYGYIQITIDADFDTFSNQDLSRVIENIKDSLGSKYITPISKERGSVNVTIEMDGQEAQELLYLIRSGKLKHLGITNAKLRRYEEIAETFENGAVPLSLSHFKKSCKSYIQKNKIKEAIQSINTSIKPDIPKYDTFSLITNNYSRIESQRISGTVNHEILSTQFSSVSQRLLGFVNDLQEEDLTVS